MCFGLRLRLGGHACGLGGAGCLGGGAFLARHRIAGAGRGGPRRRYRHRLYRHGPAIVDDAARCLGGQRGRGGNGGGARGILLDELRALLPVGGGDILVHLRQRLGRGLQPVLRGQRHQRIGAWIVAGDAVAVEQHRTQHQLRARFAPCDRFFQPGLRLGALARLEQREPVIVGGLNMALCGGLAEPAFGERRVDRNAAPQLIGLAQVELRIGIARDGGRPPFLDRLAIVALRPGLDPRLHIGQRRHRDETGGQSGQPRADPGKAAHHLRPSSRRSPAHPCPGAPLR